MGRTKEYFLIHNECIEQRKYYVQMGLRSIQEILNFLVKMKTLLVLSNTSNAIQLMWKKN